MAGASKRSAAAAVPGVSGSFFAGALSGSDLGRSVDWIRLWILGHSVLAERRGVAASQGGHRNGGGRPSFSALVLSLPVSRALRRHSRDEARRIAARGF